MPILGIMASAISGNLNSYESIATTTVGSGGSASITFSSIPSTYKHLQVRGIARVSASNSNANNVTATFNSDTTGLNYRTHVLDGDGASATAGDVQISDFYAAFGFGVGNTATASIFAGSVIDILDYANTSKNTTVRHLTGVDKNGSGIMRLGSSVWLNTAAITSITIAPRSAGNFVQHSSFALYGIKG
jgi:hypothetical protein